MPDFDDNDQIQGYNPWRTVQEYKAKIASLKSIPEWLQKPSLPALPWLTSLPWFGRNENVQPAPEERPTIGMRMAGRVPPPAAAPPEAPPTGGRRLSAVPGAYGLSAAPEMFEFDPSKIPASIRPQLDGSEDASLPALPSLPSLPWLTRTANMQRVKPIESAEDMDE